MKRLLVILFMMPLPTAAGQQMTRYRYEATTVDVSDTVARRSLINRTGLALPLQADTALVTTMIRDQQRITGSTVAWLTIARRDSAGGIVLHVVIDSTVTSSPGTSAPVETRSTSFDLLVRDGRALMLVNIRDWFDRIPIATLPEDLAILATPLKAPAIGKQLTDTTSFQESRPTMGVQFNTGRHEVITVRRLSTGVVNRAVERRGYTHDGTGDYTDLETLRMKTRLRLDNDGAVAATASIAASTVLILPLGDPPLVYRQIMTSELRRLPGR